MAFIGRLVTAEAVPSQVPPEKQRQQPATQTRERERERERERGRGREEEEKGRGRGGGVKRWGVRRQSPTATVALMRSAAWCGFAPQAFAETQTQTDRHSQTHACQ